MTVRVNKSSFNIREKLSELERPIGLKGSELMRAETAQEARDFVSAGRKNLIINGAMQVAQRGTSQSSVTSSGYYTVDRFQTMLSNLGTWTVSRETDAPNGFQYSLKHTCTTADSSPASSDYAIIYQRFETQNVKNSLRYGTSSAQNVTLSFWVKSNKTGNASTGIFFSNSGTNRYISKQYQINNSGTWEYKTITFPPNTTLTMDLGDTEGGLFVEWWMNSGSNFSGGNHDVWSTSSTVRNASNLGVGGATSDYFQITGVQLEVGKNATEFEHRSYGEELALCQRYCIVYGGAERRHLGIGGMYTSTAVNITLSTPTTMRAQPVLTKVLNGNSQWLEVYVGAFGTNSNATIEMGEGGSTNNVRLYCTGAHSGSTAGYAAWVQILAGAKLILNAEL